jgi:uncharacterized membrane protein
VPYWGIPLIYAVVAVLAGLVLPPIENALLPTVEIIGPAAAIAVCSTVGSGMLAFTAIVFSLTFVMLQFASTAYSPRLVAWVARDGIVWHSVGVFTATFLYAIATLDWVDRAGSGKVLFYSVILVLGLLLLSIAMFIALMQRVGVLQIDRMLASVGENGRQAIERLYRPLDAPAELADQTEYAAPGLTQTVTHTGTPRVLQAMDAGALVDLAAGCGGVAELAVCVGDTLVEGVPIMRVYGGRPIVSETEWRAALELGEGRTFEQDPKYALRLLVDIAIRALSPAVNDPTTAVQTLDEIEDLLRRLGRKQLEIGAFRDGAGALRLVVQFPTWADFLSLALEEIRYYGATSLQVMRRMRALVADLIHAVPAERQAPLEYYHERLNSTIARAFAEDADRLTASVEDRQGIGSPRKPGG